MSSPRLFHRLLSGTKESKMSNVVQFLESLACNPKSMSPQALADAVALTSLGAAEREALMSRNVDALNLVVGGRASMMCMIVPAENDEPQQDDAPQPDGDEAPQQESSRAA